MNTYINDYTNSHPGSKNEKRSPWREEQYRRTADVSKDTWNKTMSKAY
jgi:hypothetical protein